MDKVFEALKRIETTFSMNKEGKASVYREYTNSIYPYYQDFDLVLNALNELKQIKEAKPSEAMEKCELFYLKDYFFGYKDDKECRTELNPKRQYIYCPVEELRLIVGKSIGAPLGKIKKVAFRAKDDREVSMEEIFTITVPDECIPSSPVTQKESSLKFEDIDILYSTEHNAKPVILHYIDSIGEVKDELEWDGCRAFGAKWLFSPDMTPYLKTVCEILPDGTIKEIKNDL